MSDQHFHHTMDRQIFNLNLSVEATSAYILIATTVEENTSPTKENLLSRWTIPAEKLDKALEELTERGIIRKRPASDGQMTYQPNPASVWR